MRESKLLPILRSQTQGELLARLFLNPEREFMISELARTLRVSVPGLHHEVVRLFESGYLFERREGRNRLIRANTNMAIAEPLTNLLALTYGPLPILEDALSGVAGIERAFLYGSWAKRYSGDSGQVPNDIDLGIVGTLATDDVYELILEQEAKLAREINYTIFSEADWNAGSPLIRHIKSSPLVDIYLK